MSGRGRGSTFGRGGDSRGGGRYGDRGRGGDRGGGRFSGNRDGGRSSYGGRGGDGGRPTGHRGGGGDRGTGRGRGPDLSGIKSVSSNMIKAALTKNFSFYLYSVETIDKKGKLIDSRSRRADLFGETFWDKWMSHLSPDEKKDWKRVVAFQGSFFFSARAVPGLEAANLPLEIGSNMQGETIRCVQVQHYIAPTLLATFPQSLSTSEVAIDSHRCRDCTATFDNPGALLQHCQDRGHAPVMEQAGASPAATESFIAYLNIMLNRALGERLPRWGRHFYDISKGKEEKGCTVYPAYEAEFSLCRLQGKPSLILTLDLRAKVIRNVSLLDEINPGGNKQLTRPQQEKERNKWIGEIVIYKQEKKCYTVTDLDFNQSPATLPIPGTDMSHVDYFKKKNVTLKFPNATPMVVVLGRRDQPIFLPPELVMGNDLKPETKERLPQIASFDPSRRKEAIDTIAKYLVPGAQTTRGMGGLLPSIGIMVENSRLRVDATVLPAPQLIVAGFNVPGSGAFGNSIAKANFKVNPKQSNELNIVLIRQKDLPEKSCLTVYGTIREMVNGFNTTFRLGTKPKAVIDAGPTHESHQQAVQKYFSGQVPANVFVLDFVRPNSGSLDQSYPVVKFLLGKGGYLSQFVNFKKCPHAFPGVDDRKSGQILQGVTRQILQKCGVRLWWTNIPPELPLPAMFIGVDVFHAPMAYNAVTKSRGRKASCAAIIVEIIRDNAKTKMEIYSKTFKRTGGEEYNLAEPLRDAVAQAVKLLNVKPASVVVWRDGIGESSFTLAQEEIRGVRDGLSGATVGQGTKSTPIPLAYVVCQKRIATKFLVEQEGSKALGAPTGTLVSSVTSLNEPTFYITGTAPPFSTPKPTRFTVLEQDKGLARLDLPRLSSAQCYDYPNWTGPIKVPATVQMAHKLAELGGQFSDCGESINATKYVGRPYFL